MKRSAGAANEQVAVAGTEDASTHLAVANSDHATQQVSGQCLLGMSPAVQAVQSASSLPVVVC